MAMPVPNYCASFIPMLDAQYDPRLWAGGRESVEGSNFIQLLVGGYYHLMARPDSRYDWSIVSSDYL